MDAQAFDDGPLLDELQHHDVAGPDCEWCLGETHDGRHNTTDALVPLEPSDQCSRSL